MEQNLSEERSGIFWSISETHDILMQSQHVHIFINYELYYVFS